FSYTFSMLVSVDSSHIFFFSDPATPKNSTLSLHDALPISYNVNVQRELAGSWAAMVGYAGSRGYDLVNAIEGNPARAGVPHHGRSEEHTSELQSRGHLVCRLLLEKKNANIT